MIKILPVSDKETYDKVVAASIKDGHYAIAPTHFWEDSNGEVNGYFSNGLIQACHFWMRSDSQPRLSRETILACKTIAKETNPMIKKLGHGIICCAESSPFHSKLEKHFGFKPLVKTTLFMVEV